MGIRIDRKTVGAPKRLWAGPDEPEGSDSDQPTVSPIEPSSPPHSGAMDSVRPGPRVGVASDFALPEGMGLMGGDVGLDEGVAPGSWGVEAAPTSGFVPHEEVGQLCVCLQRYV